MAKLDSVSLENLSNQLLNDPFSYVVIGRCNGTKLSSNEKYPSITIGSNTFNVRDTTDGDSTLRLGDVVIAYITAQLGGNAKVYTVLDGYRVLKI